MTNTLAVLALMVAVPGGLFSGGRTVAVVPVPQPAPVPHAHHHHPGGRIVAPGPGDGWGFPNGNPDGYGWVDYGTALPLGADRTPDYFFPRYYALLPEQTFLPSYFNPYENRGQRYVPFAGCGGAHPFGGTPVGPSSTPVRPDREAIRRDPVVPVPSFTGEAEAPPTSGGTATFP